MKKNDKHLNCSLLIFSLFFEQKIKDNGKKNIKLLLLFLYFSENKRKIIKLIKQ